MKFRQFLSVVPNAVKLWGWVLVGVSLVVGLVAGYVTGDHGGARFRSMALGGGAGLGLGVMLVIWLVCLGFVFADARRRNMRAVLWVLVAALFPHLLGFLLYFVMRLPIAGVCGHCGMTVASQQRFCSWCGSSLVPPGPENGAMTGDAVHG